MTTRPQLVRHILAALVVASCTTPGPSMRATDLDQPDPGPSPAEWDRGFITASGQRVDVECPNISGDQEGFRSEAYHDTTVAAPLAGAIRLIPEYHDCQRLTMPAAPRNFGPLVAIFASEALGTISEEAFRQSSGMPVAQIVNFSETMPYGPLGIRPGYSCLYLRMEPQGDWKARLRWRDTDITCPALTAGDWNGNGPLKVVALKPSPDAAHYPAVARWDREETKPIHYMGLKCLDAWCEIGAGNFVSSKSPQHPHHTGRIKGWYDEQNLAVVDSVAKTMTPGVRARIVPAPRLDTLDIRHFSCTYPCPVADGWVHVATTFVSDTSSYYKRKMNFDADTVTGNTIHLRRHVKASGLDRWESRIISARGDTAYHATWRVNHSAHTNHPVPSTARWHWREQDESTWTRCAVGCCETRPIPLPDHYGW